MDGTSERAALLQSLKDRASRILTDMEHRTVTGLAAIDLIAPLVAEKEATTAAANSSGLTPLAFGVYWSLRGETALLSAGLSPRGLGSSAKLPKADRRPIRNSGRNEARRPVPAAGYPQRPETTWPLTCHSFGPRMSFACVTLAFSSL